MSYSNLFEFMSNKVYVHETQIHLCDTNKTRVYE